MAKLLPFMEVGQDPRDNSQFMLLTLSGARQLAEVINEAIKIISDGLAQNPELDDEVCKIETQCDKVHVVFMTDNTLGKIMDQAKSIVGLPKDFNPWTDKNGKPMVTDIPDWLLGLGGEASNNLDEDVETLKGLLGGQDGPVSPDTDPED